jgi:hypothetical protein
MNKGEQAAFTVGVVFGAFIMFLPTAFVINEERGAAQQQAIDHGAARYNATSGEFEWIERVEVSE